MELDNKTDFEPKGKLQTLQYVIYNDKSTYRMIKILSHVLSFSCVYALVAGLVFLFPSEKLMAIGVLVSCGVPFILVSVFRRVLNAPRPYELLPFYNNEAPKKKKGRSMPSRHVFSAFVIGTTLAFVNPFMGIAVFVNGDKVCPLNNSPENNKNGWYFLQAGSTEAELNRLWADIVIEVEEGDEVVFVVGRYDNNAQTSLFPSVEYID